MTHSLRQGGLWVAFAAMICAATPGLAYAQNSLTYFSDTNAPLPQVGYSSAAWGDYDRDGDLDILLTGQSTAGGPVSKVYRNNLNGTFTDAQAALVGVCDGSVAWGDYDRDGDLDILLIGRDSAQTPVSKVYRNDGGAFTDIRAALTGVCDGAGAWGDCDNDGDLDILLTGQDRRKVGFAAVYRNDGAGIFTAASRLATTYKSSGAWGDYDNDGDLDIVLSGWVDRKGPFAAVYRNDGNLTFKDVRAALTPVWQPSVAWGDYDRDGDRDLLLTGRDANGIPVSKVFRNDGRNIFTDTRAPLPGVAESSVAWGDYDRDGYLDILLTGRDSNNAALSRVYWNNRGNGFSLAHTLRGVADSGAAWGDYDKDGDSDILLTGSLDARLYRNEGMQNNPPVANAGGPYGVECGSAVVLLDGSASADPDGDPLTCSWTTAQQGARFSNPALLTPTLDISGVAFDTTFEITLTVSDGASTSRATATVRVGDTKPPVITCPADITQQATSPQGNVVTYTASASDACSSQVSVVCDPPSGTLFPAGSSTVVTCTATDGAGNQSQSSFTVTVLPLQVTSVPVLKPGTGWTEPTPQPGPIGTGFAADAKAIARWDVVPYQTFVGAFEVGVVAFHINGIDRVEFSVDNGPWVAVREMTLNPRTQVKEYWVQLNGAAFPKDGAVEVRAVAYPTAGVPRVLAGAYDLTKSYQGSHWTGEHSLTLYANPGGTLVEQVVELQPGRYTWGIAPLYYGVQPDKNRWFTYRPAPGVSRDQVIIDAGASTYPALRDFKRIKIEGLTIQGTGGNINWYADADDMLWFDNVRLIGYGQFDVNGGTARAGHQWWTDCWISDSRSGQATQFVRNCRFERIGEDVIRYGYFLTNLDVSYIDSGATAWHSGVVANPIVHDNRIYYGMKCYEIGNSLIWALRNGTDTYWQNYDVAIVGCDGQLAESSPRAQTWYCGGDTRNMFVKDSRFVGGAFVWRTSTDINDYFQFRGYNVVLERININDNPGATPLPNPMAGVTIR